MVQIEELEVIRIVLAIILSSGKTGLKLKDLEKEFEFICGFPLPYKSFGAESLKSWIVTLPDVYLVRDNNNEETLYQHSRKSLHIKQLIYNQRTSQTKNINDFNSRRNNKYRPKKPDTINISHIHQSINTVAINEIFRFEEFNKLECMLPLFYNHQAIGDDFLLDIADTKFGYYVPDEGPNACGMCVSQQTIAELTMRVKATKHLAPRVVIMIGLSDLLMGKNVNDMIFDLRMLVSELKQRNTRITLLTLVPTPKLSNMSNRFFLRMQIFNNAILDYSFCSELKCNVIDMHNIFMNEQNKFQRNQDRLYKVTKKDKYKVFSDFGRKIFISTLKTCLVEQLVAGH